MPELERIYTRARFSTNAIEAAANECRKITDPAPPGAPGLMSISRGHDTWSYDTVEEFFRAYQEEWDSFSFRPFDDRGYRLAIIGSVERTLVRVSLPTKTDVLMIFSILEGHEKGGYLDHAIKESEGNSLPGGSSSLTSADPRSKAPTVLAPASDRTVSLNHNAPEYRSLVDALGKLEESLRKTNNFPIGDDREQRVAELSAGRRLLQAIKVHPHTVMTVLGAVLLFCIREFAGHEIGELAGPTLNLLRDILK